MNAIEHIDDEAKVQVTECTNQVKIEEDKAVQTISKSYYSPVIKEDMSPFEGHIENPDFNFMCYPDINFVKENYEIFHSRTLVPGMKKIGAAFVWVKPNPENPGVPEDFIIQGYVTRKTIIKYLSELSFCTEERMNTLYAKIFENPLHNLIHLSYTKNNITKLDPNVYEEFFSKYRNRHEDLENLFDEEEYEFTNVNINLFKKIGDGPHFKFILLKR